MVKEKGPATQVSLIEAAEKYTTKLFQKKQHLPSHFVDVKHTEKVVKTARQLAGTPELNAEDRQAIELAALFHNTGMTVSPKNFWEESQKIAAAFLQKNEAPPALVEQVKGLIATLDLEQEPADLPEKLFLDAYADYYGSKKYRKLAKRLRKEEIAAGGDFVEDYEGEKLRLDALKSHDAATPKTWEDLPALLEKKEKEGAGGGPKKKKKKDEKDMTPSGSISADSGARTMFKTALRNHIDLTNIADQKANMMLSINALIITIGLPAFATYLSGTSYLIIPGVIFLLTSVFTMLIATYATRPVKTTGETDLTTLLSGKSNLFFFGNFYRLSQPDYQAGIKAIVADREYLDASFVNDLYYLGLALGDKFRYLRLCYSVFAIGLLLSLAAFVVTYLISKSGM